MTEEQAKMLEELHAAIMQSPPGSKRPPLIETMNTMATVYITGRWSIRAILWLVPTVAGLIVAFRTITGGVQ